MVDCKINPNSVRINFTIYQLNKSTIEFYLPYEDVQNALKESAQTPLYVERMNG